LANAVRADPHLTALLKQKGDPKDQTRALSRWLERISELKNSLVLPSMVEDGDERLLYDGYDAELRASGALDYDDLLLLTYRLFEDRPKIAEFYQRQYKYISIDEAQDLNEAQYGLLTSLCGTTFRNIMAVGDPKQAIYVWNGADPKYLDLFAQHFDATRVALNENFRCSKAVVTAACRLEPSYSVEGQLPVKGELAILECEDEADEATEVVSKLQSLLSDGHPDVEGGITLDRCAVLGRNRFVFGALESALKEGEVSFYKKLSAAAHQSESNVVEEFELVLRLLANPRDRLHREMLVKAWGVPPIALDGVSAGQSADPLALVHGLTKHAQCGHASEVWTAISAMQWTESDFHLSNALNSLGTSSVELAENERALVLNDVAEWRKHWDYYVRSEPGGSRTVGSFLGQVALGTTQQPKEDGLALLTVHSAKGMEFDVVFLIGMAEGTFPDYRAKGASLEEEQRSAFVAITRSKRLLYVFYPKMRVMPWGAQKLQRPSRYLAQMVG